MTTSAEVAVAVVVAATGLASATLVARTATRVPRGSRGPYALSAAAPLALSAGVVFAGPLGPAGVGASIGGYGTVTAGCLLAIGRDAERGSAATRRLVDGVLVGGCALYVAWSLLLASGTPGRGRPADLAILVPGALVTAASLAIVSGLWRARPRLALSAAALAATVAAATSLPFVPAGAPGPVAVAAALLGTALLIRGLPGESTGPRPEPRHGALLVWVAVPLAVLAGAAHPLLYGRPDNAGLIVAATAIGVVFGLRQTLAMRDVRTYAMQLARREARFRVLAHTDPLTGLANRRAFEQVLAQRAADGGPGVVLFVDLDDFKRVNDEHGHDAGDAVLVEVAHRLQASVRPADIAARLGGDEFAVLLWLREAEATLIASRLRAVLSDPYLVGGAPVTVSASIGLAHRARIGDPSDLVRHADLALRFAKQHGKDRVAGHDEAYQSWLARRDALDIALREALAGDGLSVRYEPVVAVDEDRIVGAEAVVRWHHPDLGAVAPGELARIADDCGVTAALGRRVLHEACRKLGQWSADGHDIWVAVKVTARELHSPRFLGDVTEVQRAHRVPPSRLVLAVSEHAVAQEPALADRLAALRAAGALVALDEVGMGYSALGRLGSVPADLLKIGAAIVAQPPAGPGRPAGPLVEVLTRLGDRLDIGVVAAGVAGPEQLAVVRAAGCRFAQGDLCGAPLPAEHFEARLHAQPRLPRPRLEWSAPSERV